MNWSCIKECACVQQLQQSQTAAWFVFLLDGYFVFTTGDYWSFIGFKTKDVEVIFVYKSPKAFLPARNNACLVMREQVSPTFPAKLMQLSSISPEEASPDRQYQLHSATVSHFREYALLDGFGSQGVWQSSSSPTSVIASSTVCRV